MLRPFLLTFFPSFSPLTCPAPVCLGEMELGQNRDSSDIIPPLVLSSLTSTATTRDNFAPNTVNFIGGNDFQGQLNSSALSPAASETLDWLKHAVFTVSVAVWFRLKTFSRLPCLTAGGRELMIQSRTLSGCVTSSPEKTNTRE